MSKQLAYRDRVAAYFKDHPNTWIDGISLEPIGGKYAWRSRVSDCRTELGMTIENRQRRPGRTVDGRVCGPVVSEYRYLPPVETPADPPGHNANVWALR